MSLAISSFSSAVRKLKLDIDESRHPDGPSVLPAGNESPASHRDKRVLIETKSECTNDAPYFRISINVHEDFDGDDAFDPLGARCIAVQRWIRVLLDPRRTEVCRRCGKAFGRDRRIGRPNCGERKRDAHGGQDHDRHPQARDWTAVFGSIQQGGKAAFQPGWFRHRQRGRPDACCVFQAARDLKEMGGIILGLGYPQLQDCIVARPFAFPALAMTGDPEKGIKPIDCACQLRCNLKEEIAPADMRHFVGEHDASPFLGPLFRARRQDDSGLRKPNVRALFLQGPAKRVFDFSTEDARTGRQ